MNVYCFKPLSLGCELSLRTLTWQDILYLQLFPCAPQVAEAGVGFPHFHWTRHIEWELCPLFPVLQ